MGSAYKHILINTCQCTAILMAHVGTCVLYCVAARYTSYFGLTNEPQARSMTGAMTCVAIKGCQKGWLGHSETGQMSSTSHGCQPCAHRCPINLLYFNSKVTGGCNLRYSSYRIPSRLAIEHHFDIIAPKSYSSIQVDIF